MRTVYLCGPINGRSDDDCTNWRERAKVIINAAGGETLDPMRRDYRGRELEPGIATEIVEGDKRDVEESDVVLVYTDQPSDGTAMEILMAWQLGISVYVVNRRSKPMSPWIIYHSTAIFSSLDEACAAALS